MNILIVDDDESRRASLVNHLADKHVTSREEIFEADCADAAKRALTNSFFDVLILDVVLPKRSKETGDPKYGLALLGQLTRSAKLRKPEKIIGITAYIDDIHKFRDEFEAYCLTVIEANPKSFEWRDKLVNSLAYSTDSRLGRAVSFSGVQALTIHGIRTFGSWQNRLKKLVHRRIGDIPFHSYKYGYFSGIAFLVPPLRNREVIRLTRHLKELFLSSNGQKFVIFSHSFGTYLIANALYRLSKEFSIPVSTLVLSGSVLRRDYDWSALHRAGVKVVNDCADSDYVLWVSEMFVLGAGMAGKSGFYGFENHFLVNRFFEGGHSTYFNGDEFMNTYWVPLFDNKQPVVEVDCRSPSTIMHEILDKSVMAIGALKRTFERVIWFLYSSLSSRL